MNRIRIRVKVSFGVGGGEGYGCVYFFTGTCSLAFPIKQDSALVFFEVLLGLLFTLWPLV